MQDWKHKFYKSKQWRQTRAYVLQRDNYTCKLCGEIIADSPEVHHTVELTEKNYQDENISLKPGLLETLCKNCHNKKHGRFMENEKETIVDDDLNIDYTRR